MSFSEIANTAFFDPIECFDKKGEILPLRRMPKRARQVISRLGFRDGAPSQLIFRDRFHALRILADHLGLFKQPFAVSSAPRAEESRMSIEKLRQLAGLEREGKMPSPEEG